jgi:Carboxypeptidase regulatory-like domain/TonB-dependent Receptor Plug Domain
MRIPGIAALLALLATPLSAQVVRGKVLDAATGEPVPQAEVTAASAEGRGAGRARSAVDGSFTLELRAAGTFTLRAERAGYQPSTSGALPVGVRETLEVELRISATALAMEPLRVTARMEPPRRRALELNGFYDRERRGLGKFVRREDLERGRNLNMAQALSRVEGARVLNLGAHQYIFFPRNGSPRFGSPAAAASRGPLNTRPPAGPPTVRCLPHLYVDGSRMTYDAQADINAAVSPDQVEAIEVYRGPSEIPAQYAGNDAMCGVILIWTKVES